MGKILGIVKKPVEPALEPETKVDPALVKKKCESKGKSKSSKKNSSTVEKNPIGSGQQTKVVDIQEPVAVINGGNGRLIEPVLNLAQPQVALYSSSKSKRYFQAIGKISGEISFNLAHDSTIHELENNNIANITFEKREFPLYFISCQQRQRKIANLKNAIAEYQLAPIDQKEPNLQLIVYPITSTASYLSTSSFSYRSLVTEQNRSEYRFLKMNHFILSGLWESIDGQTYIQIQSKKLIEPLNVPVDWDDCPIQVSSNHSIHVSIEAVFNPASGKFDYAHTLKEPSEYHSPFYRRLGVEYAPPILRATI